MNIYYNTKTTATSKMTKAEFDGLSDGIRKKYRLANEDEIALHNQRQAKLDMRKNRNKATTKKAESKTAGKKSNAKADDSKKGTDDKATS